MEFHANDPHVGFTQAMKDYVLQKVEKLSKYLNDNNGDRAVLKKEGHLLKLELTLGGIRASASDSNFYLLVPNVIHKMERQIRKYNQVKKGRKRGNHDSHELLNKFILEDFETIPAHEYSIIEKTVNAEEMYREDAIERMELLGHSFFIFVDKENKATSVVYKRFDEQYGCLVLV